MQTESKHQVGKEGRGLRKRVCGGKGSLGLTSRTSDEKIEASSCGDKVKEWEGNRQTTGKERAEEALCTTAIRAKIKRDKHEKQRAKKALKKNGRRKGVSRKASDG